MARGSSTRRPRCAPCGEAPAADAYRYAIDLPPRTCYATAAIDDNQNGPYFEDGERIGFWRNQDSVEPIVVRAGEVVPGIDLDLVPYIPVEASPWKSPRLTKRLAVRVRGHCNACKT